MALLLFLNSYTNAATQGSSFTYQGELLVSGQVANGNYEFEAQFYDAATNGVNIGNNFNIVSTISNGLFTLQLDIGDGAFVGNEVWLELLVKPAGGNTQIHLLPRQLITNSPYSIQSSFVGDNGVSSASIENGTILAEDIAINAIGNSEIGTDAIGTDEIIDGTITSNDINKTSVQKRITASCSAGSSIREVTESGGVTCETDDDTPGWGVQGNSGTVPGTNFIGTTDDKDFEIKINNIQAIKFQSGNVRPNIIMGGDSNQIEGAVFGGLIASGQSNSIIANDNNISGEVAILSGSNHSIVSDIFQVTGSVIAGGRDNTVSNSHSTISGGVNNSIEGVSATIPGGADNTANGRYSFAAGYGSKALHHGTWVWNDSSDEDNNNSLSTTADNQFLIRAEGGVGIGTNTPKSPLHVKGQGSTFGVLTNQIVATIEPKSTTDNVAFALNRLDVTKESALVFSTFEIPEFDIRSVAGGALDFTSYDVSGGSQFMMRINDKTTNRIDINTNIEPQVNNIFNLGSSSFRWSTVFAQNPLDTPSDKRLKKDINDMDYGLAEILAMRPVTYHWKEGDTTRLNLGLIAQEVENIVPEIVQKADDVKQTRSMRYAELIPVLIKATQEQQTLIDQQNKYMAKQDNELTELKNLVQSILHNPTIIK